MFRQGWYYFPAGLLCMQFWRDLQYQSDYMMTGNEFTKRLHESVQIHTNRSSVQFSFLIFGKLWRRCMQKWWNPMNIIWAPKFRKAMSCTNEKSWFASSLTFWTGMGHCTFGMTTIFILCTTTSSKLFHRVRVEPCKWLCSSIAIRSVPSWCGAVLYIRQ